MRAEAEYRLRCVLPDHLVYPLRSVGRHMSQQSGSGFTERPEELGQGVLVPALVSPHQAPGVVVDHARQVPVPLTDDMRVISSIPILVSPSS